MVSVIHGGMTLVVVGGWNKGYQHSAEVIEVNPYGHQRESSSHIILDFMVNYVGLSEASKF